MELTQVEQLRRKYAELSGVPETEIDERWKVKKLTEEIAKLEAKDEKVYGNIRTDVEINKNDDNSIVFFMTDGGAIREIKTDGLAQSVEPVKVLKRMSPKNFLDSFKHHYENDGRFHQINEPMDLVRMFLNIDNEIVDKVVDFEIRKAESRDQESRIKNTYRTHYSVLKLNGSNQYIQKGDIVHCPDIKNIDVFPTKYIKD